MADFSRRLLAVACVCSIQSMSGSASALNVKANQPNAAEIAGITLLSDNAKSITLAELAGHKVTVLIFLSLDCPTCTSYSENLSELNKSMAPRGVGVIGIVEESTEYTREKSRLQEQGFHFPVVFDEKGRAAELLGAKVTPEALVLNSRWQVRYRGRIDNAFAERLKRNYQTTSHDLRDAIEDLLADRVVQNPKTNAVGCPISRQVPRPAGAGSVTYHRDVVPILQKNCQTCHRPGEVGPFSLLNYGQAVKWGDDIKEYTQNRKMPPWKPSEGPAFQNDRRLSQEEIDALAAWVDSGMPEGNAHDEPAPRQFAEGWQLGRPDLTLQADIDFTLGPRGRDLFRCFVLPTHIAEDKYVTAIEVRPGNPRIVHHALLFVDVSGKGRQLEAAAKDHPKKIHPADDGPGYSVDMGVGFPPRSGMGGWAPGVLGRTLPGGACYFLPKNSDIVLQVHYHRDGRTEKDRTRIGLYFADKPVRRIYQDITVAGTQLGARYFVIPAGAKDFLIQGTTWIDQECDIYSVMPHMHLLGRSIKVTMTPPEGAPVTLISVPDWDYNWQEFYFFEQPIHVQAGTRFDVAAHYDNSGDNVNNPFRPPRLVTFGEQTTNEMCFGFIGATSDKPGRIAQRRKPLPAVTDKKSPTESAAPAK
jgi:peroxiredoxin